MEYCIIIRGPAGIGKTTIAKELAKKIKADYFSYDEIMRINKLDTIVGDGIPSSNFVKANQILLPLITSKKRVILDGCFYREEQLNHLLNNLNTKVHIFTLDSDLKECISRNKHRQNPMTEDNIKQVYDLVSRLKVGINIDATSKNVLEVTSEILNHLNR